MKVSLWYSRLSIQHCHCSSLGRCCGMGSIPGPGTAICQWGGDQKKKGEENTLKKISCFPETASGYLSCWVRHELYYIQDIWGPIGCDPLRQKQQDKCREISLISQRKRSILAVPKSFGHSKCEEGRDHSCLEIYVKPQKLPQVKHQPFHRL